MKCICRCGLGGCASKVAETKGLSSTRLREIKRNWIGDGQGLAITGNESYRQVAELLAALESADHKSESRNIG